MNPRAKVALVTAVALAAIGALWGLPWALALWSPNGLAAFAASLVGLVIGWRCAWLHAAERDGKAR